MLGTWSNEFYFILQPYTAYKQTLSDEHQRKYIFTFLVKLSFLWNVSLCMHECVLSFICMQAHLSVQVHMHIRMHGESSEDSAVFPQTPFIYWPRTNQVEQIGWPVSPGSLPLSIPSPLTLKGHTTMLRFLKNVSLFKIFIQYLLIMFSLSKFLPDLPRLAAYPVSCPFCLFLIWVSGIKLTLLYSQGKHFTD